MFALDEIAYKSRFRAHSPVGKLLFCLSLLAASLLSPTPLVPLIVLAISTALLCASTKFSLPKILAATYASTALFMLASAAVFAFLQPGKIIFSFQPLAFPPALTREGINLSVLLACRGLAGLAILFFFSSSTPLPHLFTALLQVGVPQYLAELTILVYRYSFMLLEQMGQMYTAASCRLGFSSLSRSFHTSGSILSGLFGRSMDFADRAQAALSCRNYSGSFPAFRKPAPLTAAWIGASALSLALLYAIGHSASGILVF